MTAGMNSSTIPRAVRNRVVTTTMLSGTESEFDRLAIDELSEPRFRSARDARLSNPSKRFIDQKNALKQRKRVRRARSRVCAGEDRVRGCGWVHACWCCVGVDFRAGGVSIF